MPEETGVVDPDAAIDAALDQAPPESAPESESAPAPKDGTPAPSDAKPRDLKGRFVSPSPADPTAEAASQEAPADGESPEPGTDTAPTDTADDLSDLPEFLYRAAGQEQSFPGTFVSPDGEVLFTKDALPILKQKLALADSFPQYRAQMQRDHAQASNRAQASEAMVELIFAKMEELAANPDAAWDWWSNVAGNWSVLKADAKAAAAELRAQAAETRGQEMTRAQRDAEERPQMLGLIESAIRQWGPEAGLDKAGQDRLIRRYSSPDWLDRLFPRAVDDDPVSGLRRGERIGSLYENLLAQELVLIRDLRGKPEPKEPAEPKAKAPTPKPTAPPTVSAKKGPAPTATSPKVPKFTSTQEADDWIFDHLGIEDT